MGTGPVRRKGAPAGFGRHGNDGQARSAFVRQDQRLRLGQPATRQQGLFHRDQGHALLGDLRDAVGAALQDEAPIRQRLRAILAVTAASWGLPVARAAC